MKIWVFALALILTASRASAQDSSAGCVEVWNYWLDHVRHTVHLDDGHVVSRQIPATTGVYQGEDSPDGHYNAKMEPREPGSVRYRLLLTDRIHGISIPLADGVSGLEWSPDGKWLAYMQSREDRSLGGLALYNMDTGQRVIGTLPENNWEMLGIDWSPDGSVIAATFIVDSTFLGSDVQLFSVPDLKLVKTFKTLVSSAKVRWSPDARTIAAYGINNVFAMIDVASEQIFHVGLDGAGYYEVEWSPGGTYLMVNHSFGDLSEMMDILSVRGNFLAHNRTITASEWVNDHQALARLWTATGRDDLTFFDLENGTQRLIQAHVWLDALSPDGRYVAVSDGLENNTLYVVDLSGAEDTKKIDANGLINSLIWRADGGELIAFFEDRTLRGYDLANAAWRAITDIPGSEWMLRRVACDA